MQRSIRSLAIPVAVLSAVLLLAGTVPGIGITFKITGQANREGMPLGGIGAGSVEIFPDGRFGNAELRNNWGRGYELFGFFPALNVKTEGGSVTRLLHANPSYDLPPVSEIEFNGEFPLATQTFRDSALPVEVSSSIFCSFIPGDAKNSALPAFAITYAIKNPGQKPVTATLAQVLQNFCAESVTALSEERPLKFALTGGRTFEGVRMGLKPGYLRKASKRARVLLISDRPHPEVSYIFSEVAGFEFDWATGNPIKLPTDDPAALAVNYDAIWLMDTPNMRQSLSEANMALIRDAVVKGCGFLITGGPNSFAAGGLHGTPIEEISPVDFTDKPDAFEGPIYTRYVDVDSPLIIGLPWPTYTGLGGYNKIAGLKKDAKPLLKTPGGDVVLATSTYKGVPVAAFASSPFGSWKTPWDGWTGFYQNMIAYVTRSRLEPGGGVPLTWKHYGDITAGYITEPGEEGSVTVKAIHPADFVACFNKDGSLGTPGKQPYGRFWVNAKSMEIKPGETRKAIFLFTWNFPNLYDAEMNLLGHQYSNWFADSVAVAKHFGDNFAGLERKTRLWHDSIRQGNLGPWTGEMVTNALSALVKSTWWTADGRFGMIESNEGNPVLNSVDAAYYGSTVVAALFPELDKSALKQIAAAQGTNGMPAGYIPSDLGAFSLSSPSAGVNGVLRKDLVPMFTLMAYRDYLWTADLAFLKAMWPHIKQGTEWLAKTDADGNGLPDHNGADSYFYNWKLTGSSAYSGTLWLANLEAARRIAETLGDKTYIKTCDSRLEKARKALDSELWTGSFLAVCKGNGSALPQTCLSEQLTGQWYSYMVGIGSLIPEEKGKAIVDTVLKRCSDKNGILVAGLPDGKPDPAVPGITNAISPGIGYATASGLLYTELPYDGRVSTGNAGKIQDLAKAIFDYLGNTAKTPWDQWQTYLASTASPAKEPHYVGSMSAWTFPMAALGLQYDAVQKHITFWPRLKTVELSMPFAVPGAYGLFTQNDGVSFDLTIDDGDLPVDALVLGNQWISPKSFGMTLNGKGIECHFARQGPHIMAVFPKTLHLKAGDKMHWIVL